MRRLVALLAAVLVTAVSAAAAAAGTFTLHPSGFGEHSYSAWNGQQGLPDLTGNQNQALYFQKMTSTATNACRRRRDQGLRGTSV
jgi:Spy/CpxP family protein refolding chaperone